MEMLVEISLRDPERVWRVYKTKHQTFHCQEILLIREHEYVFEKEVFTIKDAKHFFECLDIKETDRVNLYKYSSPQNKKG
jgi:hypothetical protein